MRCCLGAEPAGSRLSEQAPFFDAQGGGAAPLEAVAAWVADSLRQEGDSSNMLAGAAGLVGAEARAHCRACPTHAALGA